ncbi:hypothetical protein DPMN_160802 [Dreissena polymorpha]|uniref:Chitin-binding type-2 domain-containing protein n=1 Tax=Dreissena polymorpha TaxID=45954 RepID=A0A9D4ERV2_DREPO|nr:hypothetical protein DPMN_160802 [Dreissena polymorpha]
MMDRMFTAPSVPPNIAGRYRFCTIDTFRHDPENTQSHIQFTHSLIFSGKDPLPKQEVDGVMTANTELYRRGEKLWNLIGEMWLINRLNYAQTPVNLVDMTMSLPKLENKSVSVQLMVRLVGFPALPGVQDRDSLTFLASEAIFCTSAPIQDVFQRLGNASKNTCGVDSISPHVTDGTTEMTFTLTFHDVDTSVGDLKRHVVGIILDSTPRIENEAGPILKFGAMDVAENSLRRNANDSTLVESTANSKVVVTVAEDPCSPDKHKVTLPDMNNPAGFFICYKGSSFKSACAPPGTFDPVTLVCV